MNQCKCGYTLQATWAVCPACGEKILKKEEGKKPNTLVEVEMVKTTDVLQAISELTAAISEKREHQKEPDYQQKIAGLLEEIERLRERQTSVKKEDRQRQIEETTSSNDAMDWQFTRGVSVSMPTHRQGRKTAEMPLSATPFRQVDDAGTGRNGQDYLRAMAYSSEDPALQRLQRMNDDLYYCRILLGADFPEAVRSSGPVGKLFAGYRRGTDRLRKAMDTAESGAGSDWLPTQFSADLIDAVNLDMIVPNLVRRQDMPTKSFTLPVAGAYPTGYLVSEATADASSATFTASDPATANKTLTAVKIGVLTYLSEELTEDSIIPILPYVREMHTRGISESITQAILNGDISGTHMDTDVTAAADRRKAWSGFRKLVQSGNRVDISTFNSDTINSVLKKMGKYALPPGDVVCVVGPTLSITMLGLKDNQNNQVVVSMDKLGPAATMLTGQLGVVSGRALVVDQYARENLSTTGYYDGVTTNLADLVFFNRNSFVLGDRRLITAKIDATSLIHAGQIKLVTSWRGDFKCLFDDTAEDVCAVGYNVTP